MHSALDSVQCVPATHKPPWIHHRPLANKLANIVLSFRQRESETHTVSYRHAASHLRQRLYIKRLAHDILEARLSRCVQLVAHQAVLRPLGRGSQGTITIFSDSPALAARLMASPTPARSKR